MSVWNSKPRSHGWNFVRAEGDRKVESLGSVKNFGGGGEGWGVNVSGKRFNTLKKAGFSWLCVKLWNVGGEFVSGKPLRF